MNHKDVIPVVNCKRGVNKDTPTELSREDIDNSVAYIINEIAKDYDENTRINIFMVSAVELAEDISNLWGFKATYGKDYRHDDFGFVGNVRIRLTNDVSSLVYDKSEQGKQVFRSVFLVKVKEEFEAKLCLDSTIFEGH